MIPCWASAETRLNIAIARASLCGLENLFLYILTPFTLRSRRLNQCWGESGPDEKYKKIDDTKIITVNLLQQGKRWLGETSHLHFSTGPSVRNAQDENETI